MGELSELETSVAGVDGRETWELEDTLGEDSTSGFGIGLRFSGLDPTAKVDIESHDCVLLNDANMAYLPSQFAQKCWIGVTPFGERIKGMLHPAFRQEPSVKTCNGEEM